MCPGWIEWGDWQACTRTCGTGVQPRARFCKYEYLGETNWDYCNGEAPFKREERPCHKPACNAWGAWQDFGHCSAACGGGTKTRHRPCARGQCLLLDTLGYETVACNEQ